MSIEELQQELELRQRDEARKKLISIRESLSVVFVAINSRNKEIANIDRNITQVENNLKELKNKRVNENKQLKELEVKETNLKKAVIVLPDPTSPKSKRNMRLALFKS
jgi:chromosome segregation ATPase